METKGINVLEKLLKEYNGKDAIISISHKLYGEQKIKSKVNFIFDEKRVGFRVKNGQEIFVYREDILDYGTKDGMYIADELMEINIKLNK